MKKIIALLLAVILMLSLAACSASTADNTDTTASAVTNNTSANTETQTQESTADKKILTVYFSAANTADVDAVSSATPNYDGFGATEYLAEYIHSKVGGDIAKLTPVKDYPLNYNDCADAAKKETDSNERPEFQALDINPEDYDVIFVGYPMWWYTLPMVMYTFFDTYDLSGKTIIPFNTHEGSGDGGTYDDIKELEPNATVLDGFNVRGSSADEADSDLDKWLTGLNY